MSWPKPVPAAAVIQVGQRSRSLIGLKRDKMVINTRVYKEKIVKKNCWRIIEVRMESIDIN